MGYDMVPVLCIGREMITVVGHPCRVSAPLCNCATGKTRLESGTLR